MTTNPLTVPFQSGIELQTISKTGRVPKMRLSDAQKAQSIVANVEEANRPRNRIKAGYKGMFDGNPPMPPSALRNSGQANRFNFNTREAKAKRSAALTPYYDLFSNAKYYAEVPIQTGDYRRDCKWSEIVTEEFDAMLKAYDNFDYVIWSMLADYVGMGRAFIGWEDSRDWRITKWPEDRVQFPNGTPISMDEWELFIVHREFTVDRLYGHIRNEKVAESAGWHVENVKEAIRLAVPADSNSIQDAIKVQQELKDHDLAVSCRSSTVRAANVFVKEFDGKWSRLIVLENATVEQGKAGFLFTGFSRYESVSQIICPFFFETLDDTCNGATGLGKDIMPIMQSKDRIRCAQLDNLFKRMSIVLQAKTAAGMNQIGLVQQGATTIIGPDYNVQQSTIFGDIESTIAVNRDMDVMLERNTGIYQPQIESKPGNPLTLGEFQLRMQQATVLNNSAVSRFYCQLDNPYREIYRRASKPSQPDGKGGELAKSFQKRCVERGVPVEVLQKVGVVRAYRNIGNGSPVQRQQALTALAPLSVRWPEDGQKAFMEDVVSAYTNESKVARYVDTEMAQGLPTDDQSYAMLENAAIKLGAPVTWTPSQNNVIHAQTHLQAGAQAATSLSQGADPHEVLAFLDGIGAHTVIHLQKASQDPTHAPVVKLLGEQLDQLAGIADKLKQKIQANVDQQAQLQQQAQQVLTDTEIKAMEAKGKMALKTQTTQHSMAIKEAKAQQDFVIKDATTAAAIERERLKTQAEIEQDRLKAEAKANSQTKTE